MTVTELIQQLQTFPANALVVTEGYEDGFNTIKTVSEITLLEAEKKEWYLGKYEQSPNNEGVKAVFLNAETKADNK